MRIRSTIAVMVFFAGVLVLALPQSAPPAAAQELIGRCQGLFGCFFSRPAGPARRYVPPQQRSSAGPAQRAAPSSTGRVRPARRSPVRRNENAGPPPPTAVDKLDNARVVLVVGDFLAGALAEGLEDAYAQSPGVRVVDRSNGSSGFVRDDYFDWNGKIGGIIDEVHPSAVVVMIGSNDRQQLSVGGNRVDPRSDPWTKEYVRRIDAFAKAVTSRKLPLVWTGLPAFKSPSMTSDMLAFNDLYKQEVEAAGGEFVDIWDGFVDEGGNFIFTGPDVNGQPVRLRGSDGINLTQAGKRKVAFYAEKPLAKILGGATAPDADGSAIDQLPDVSMRPVEPGETNRTQPVSLAGPDLDGGSALLDDGERKRAASGPRTGLRRMSAEPPAGRADNFSATPAVTEPAPDLRDKTTSIGK